MRKRMILNIAGELSRIQVQNMKRGLLTLMIGLVVLAGSALQIGIKFNPIDELRIKLSWARMDWEMARAYRDADRWIAETDMQLLEFERQLREIERESCEGIVHFRFEE